MLIYASEPVRYPFIKPLLSMGESLFDFLDLVFELSKALSADILLFKTGKKTKLQQNAFQNIIKHYTQQRVPIHFS